MVLLQQNLKILMFPRIINGFGNLNLVLSLDASENFYEYFRARGNMATSN